LTLVAVAEGLRGLVIGRMATTRGTYLVQRAAFDLVGYLATEAGSFAY
jgi:hypothetical protein